MARLVYMALESPALILATANPGKIRELAPLLGSSGLAVRSLADYPDLHLPPETGSTFRENAFLKAAAIARASGCLALADDSGLVVAALDGAPGVFSSRFAEDLPLLPEETKDQRNNRKLLNLLQDAPPERRGAFFQTVIAIVSPDGRELSAKGEWHGIILREPRGANGFGYDPIFYDPEVNRSAAEMSAREKGSRSHRGKALASLLKQLPRFLRDLGYQDLPELIEPRWQGRRIRIWLEPPGKWLSLPWSKTVAQLLKALNLREETAIIARNGKLLTPDRQIWSNDELLVRIVASRG